MIRIAQQGDIGRINEIYNQAVAQKFQTADIHPWTLEERKDWYKAHDPLLYPIYVLEHDNKVQGWISLSTYRNGRKALSKTVEVSYYLDKDYTGRGYGSQLLSHAIKMAKSLKFQFMVSILLGANDASIALLKKFKFQEWGKMPGIAQIEGNQIDHLYYGRPL